MTEFKCPVWLLRLIDWLKKVGADKPKQRHTTEQMAKLSDLFDGVEEPQAPPPLRSNPGWSEATRPPRPLQPPGNNSTTRRRKHHE